MKYDFILFENAYDIENHYKDLTLFAVLLKKMGYRVAIADVFKEYKLCEDNTIPHLSLRYRCPKFFSTVSKYQNKMSSVRFHLNRILQSLYLIYVIVALRKKAKNFYIGSLTSYTPSLWLFFLSRKNNYFVWGLRSHILYSWRNNKVDSFTFTSMLREYRIKSAYNIKIVTSIEIIKEEFVSLGISSERILVRPERWISIVTLNEKKNSNTKSQLNLLTIGTLRRSKHVEYVLDALKKLNDESICYTIAGRCKNDNGYEKMLTEHANGVPNIKRLNSFIDDEDFQMLLQQCDFLILCDEKEPSCATNGTMMESLMMGKPIIAPNHNPFKYEVEKYEVGLLYDFNNLDSLVEVFKKVKVIGSSFFCENILKYQDMLLEENVISYVKRQIEVIIWEERHR